MDNQKKPALEPIIVVSEYTLNSDLEEEFKTVSSEFTEALKQFPGFLDKQIFHTKQGETTAYHVLIRFDNLKHLKAWEASKIREALRKKLDHLIGCQPKYHYLTGLEAWFSLGTHQPIIPPARYKIALLSGISAYLLLFTLFSLFGHSLMKLVLPVRLLIVCTVLSVLLTYVIMPLLTRLLTGWLYPKTNN